MRVGGNQFRRHASVLLVFGVLSIAATWPLATRLGDSVLGAKYYWDAYTNTMIMGARTLNAVGHGAGGVYEDFFMAPIENSIVFNENLFGLSLMFAPIFGVTGNPVFAYNVVLLISFVLTGYFMFLLVRRLTGSDLAGVLSGIAFAYCPYTMFEIGRIQLVANQWIPLTFLFLHRAVEERRLRDIVGLGIAYALQVGTCLYYAMFLIPLLTLAGPWLLWKHRPEKVFWLRLAGVGAATGVVVLAMIYPYFASRSDFALERTEDFAQNFDGKLSFLFNVHTTNRIWTILQHVPDTQAGAHEEIAFPGLTVALLALLALTIPLAAALRRSNRVTRLRWIASCALIWGVGLSAGFGATLATRTFLPLAASTVLAAAVWRRTDTGVRTDTRSVSMYFWILLLVLCLFLGMAPFEYTDEIVKGLYYYMHTYVPGFNGIRKVSRQAIMLMLAFAILAGFGASMLFERVRRRDVRLAVFGTLACLIPLEFWSAPMRLVPLESGDRVPEVYRFVERLGTPGPIGIVPAQDGVKRFRGHRGGALHNYFTLYHRRRTLNGKSSFVPPVTALYHKAVTQLPSSVSTRIFQQLGAHQLIVHTADMRKSRAKIVLAGLHKDTANYRELFRDGDDYVFEVRGRNDPTLQVLRTPDLPEGNIVQVPSNQLSAGASRNPAQVKRAFDGNPLTKWATMADQRVGDWFEFRLAEERRVASVDFTDFGNAFDAPLGYMIETATERDDWRTVVVQPKVQIYEDQIHRPKDFVFRVVFPEPVAARRIRITILDPVPGRWWSIHETAIWADAS